MCGIVGYIGSKDALPVIIGGLEKLEYRGYDSAGVALFESGKINVTRAVGKLAELKKVLVSRPASSHAPAGIGHTRWATHGRPSENNAHPHTAGRISLIHNGIIENYAELREQLRKEGRTFKSETDTEIVAHLLDSAVQKGAQPFEALKAVCREIRGSYSFVALDLNHPDRLLVAKSATPIVVGVGDGEMIVASDIPALLEHTRRVIILEDGDVAEVRADGIRIEHHGAAITREPITVTWDSVTAQKGGFKHFMIKEIHEQGRVLADTLRGRIELMNPRVVLDGFNLSADRIRSIDRIVLVACGTAWHACLVAKFYIETLAGIPCEVDYASEFRYRAHTLSDKSVVLAISQSGETADTLAAIEISKKRCLTLAICNVLGSSLARRAEHVVFTNAGPEISVASTKAFVTQLATAYLLAVYLAQARGTLTTPRALELLNDLQRLPATLDQTIELETQIEKIAKQYCKVQDFLFLGRGSCYPIALEGALKLKEISYIHAEGYPAGEIKHGPLALVDERMPVVVVLQRSSVLFEKTVSNLREVESRGGQLIVVTDAESIGELSASCKHVVSVPHISELIAPILLTVPLQMLAYYVAVLNGTDVDLPRNLAKSVTVE